MNIEIFNPSHVVKDWIIDYTWDRLMELHRSDKEISRAKVNFQKQSSDAGEEKICEIELTIYGDSLFIHSKAGSFEKAVRDAIQELTLKVEERLKRPNEPPSAKTSSVEV